MKMFRTNLSSTWTGFISHVNWDNSMLNEIIILIYYYYYYYSEIKFKYYISDDRLIGLVVSMSDY